MGARDDYPKLHANTSGPHHQGQTSQEAQRALNEIDLLRCDVSSLLAKLAQAELKLRIAADPNASLWQPQEATP